MPSYLALDYILPWTVLTLIRTSHLPALQFLCWVFSLLTSTVSFPGHSLSWHKSPTLPPFFISFPIQPKLQEPWHRASLLKPSLFSSQSCYWSCLADQVGSSFSLTSGLLSCAGENHSHTGWRYYKVILCSLGGLLSSLETLSVSVSAHSPFPHSGSKHFPPLELC